MSNIYLTLALGTFIICVLIVAMLITRLDRCYGQSTKRRTLKTRIKYTAILTMVLASAFQPYYPPFNVSPLLLSICLLILVYDGATPYKKIKDKDEFLDTQFIEVNEVDLGEKQ